MNSKFSIDEGLMRSKDDFPAFQFNANLKEECPDIFTTEEYIDYEETFTGRPKMNNQSQDVTNVGTPNNLSDSKNESEATNSSLKLRQEMGNDLETNINGKVTKCIRVRPETQNISEIDEHSSPEKSGPKKETEFQCLKCGAIASQPKTAQRHKSTHEAGFTCSYCPQAFFTNHNAVTHEGLHRGGDLQHVDDFSQCRLCGGSFISLLYLEFHVLECHGENLLENPSIVHVGPAFIDDAEIKPEEEREGTDKEERIKRFQCGICRELFMYSLNLEGHMALHSLNIYSCGLCDSSFASLDSLIAHSRIHEDDTSNSLLSKLIQKLEKNFKNINKNNLNHNQSLNSKKRPTLYDLSSSSTSEIGKGNKRPNDDSSTDENTHKTLVTFHNKKLVTDNLKKSLQEYSQILSFVSPQICTQKSSSFEDDKDSYINPFLFHYLPGGKYYKC